MSDDIKKEAQEQEKQAIEKATTDASTEVKKADKPLEESPTETKSSIETEKKK